MALKWLNRFSSPLQHLFDLIAIKTEMMMMMMMWKVWMQCSCFYNMIHQNLPMYRPFLIMLLKLALYAPRNSALRQKMLKLCSILKIMLLWFQKMLCLISSKT